MKHPLGVNAPPGSWWSRAAHFEVAVARLAINGFRERNGSQMTNNVAVAAQMNSPSFSSSPRNNSRSTSRILMDFLPPPSQLDCCRPPSAKEALWEPRRRAVLTLFESAFRSWNNDQGRCRRTERGRMMMMEVRREGETGSVKVRA